MRQIAAFILLFLYVGLASGISLHLHFCSGDIRSVSLMGSGDSCCAESACCSAVIQASCCNASAHESCRNVTMHESCCDDAFVRLGPEIPYAKPEVFFPVFCLSGEPVSSLNFTDFFVSLGSIGKWNGPFHNSSPPPYIAFSCLKYCA